MSDRNATTPRVYLYRHGETAWTLSGQHTGTTDLALTDNGAKQVLASGKHLVGPGKLIDRAKLAHVFVSPRKRAGQTFQLAFGDVKKSLEDAGKVSVTADLAEWDYGDYEGIMGSEVRELRRSRGLDREREWDIWRNGCEGGETPQQTAARLDRLIDEIRRIQKPGMNGEKPSDVVLVAHGHILRAFVKRWLGQPMEFPLTMLLEPGGVGAVSYHEHDINDPALLVGLGFPAPELC